MSFVHKVLIKKNYVVSAFFKRRCSSRSPHVKLLNRCNNQVFQLGSWNINRNFSGSSKSARRKAPNQRKQNENILDNENVVELKCSIVDDLSCKTDIISSKYNELESPSMVTEPLAKELISILEDWYVVTNSIKVPKHHRRRNRLVHINQNNDRLVANELNRIKITCAEAMDKLLMYHIKFNVQSGNVDFMDKKFTQPFNLVMKAWKQVGATESGARTAAILELWGESYGGDLTYSPMINEFNIVLEAFANSASHDYDTDKVDVGFPAESAWETYSFLSKLNDVTLLPNAESCVHTISALTHHAFIMTYSARKLESKMNADVAAIRAFSVWKSMFAKVEENDVDNDIIWGAHSDILSLSSHGMLRRDELQNPNKNNILLSVGRDTEALLNQCLEKYGDDLSMVPKSYLKNSISSTMHAWTKEQYELIKNFEKGEYMNEDLVVSVSRAALSVEALLHKMKELDINPSQQHYQFVTLAYRNCLHESVVNLDEHGTIKETFSPHICCYEYLNEMERNCISEIDQDEPISKAKISSNIYEDTIVSFARQASFDKPKWSDIEKADIVYRKMISMFDQNLLSIDTTNEKHVLCNTLDNVLDIYLKFDSGYRESFQKSLSLLRIFQQSRSKQNPNIGTYSKLLEILARSNVGNSGSLALEIFEEMKANGVEPNPVILTQLITILGRSKDANLEICSNLLQRAFRKYDSLSQQEKEKSDFNASALCASIIKAKIRKGMNDPEEAMDLLTNLKKIYYESQDKKYRPDVVLYGTVLDSLSRRPSESSLTMSLDLLEEIETSYQCGQSELVPTNQCYTAVIKTLSKSGRADAIKQAEEILNRMESLYGQYKDESLMPDHITYSNLLFVYSRSKCGENVERSEEIVEIMEKKAKSSEILWPNASVYVALMNVYKHSKIQDMGEKSEAVIKRIDEAGQYGKITPKVDRYVFGAAIAAWASSNSPEKPVRAWNLLNEMCKRYNEGEISCKPSIIVFNHVLNACAYNKNKETQRDSVKIALMVQKKFLENTTIFGECDSLFFHSLLKVFGHCIPDFKERQRFTAATFEACAKEGYVDKAVLRALKKFSPKLYHELPGMTSLKDGPKLGKLPRDWYRNVTNKRR